MSHTRKNQARTFKDGQRHDSAKKSKKLPKKKGLTPTQRRGGSQTITPEVSVDSDTYRFTPPGARGPNTARAVAGTGVEPAGSRRKSRRKRAA